MLIKIQHILSDSYEHFYERKRGEFEANFTTEDSKIAKFGENYNQKIERNVYQQFEKALIDKLNLIVDKKKQKQNQEEIFIIFFIVSF